MTGSGARAKGSDLDRGLTKPEVGLALAVFASLTAVTFPAWPIVGPMALGNTGAVWTLGVWLVASAYIGAAWVADDHPVRARAMLLAGSVGLFGVGFVSGRTLAAWDLGPLLGLLGLVPSVLGLLAACLIGPISRMARHAPQDAGEPARPTPLRAKPNAGLQEESDDTLARAS